MRLALAELVTGSLSGMFDSTDARNTAFDFRAVGTVVDLNRVRHNEMLTVLSMVCAQSAMEAELMHPDAPRRLVGYDEAWMAMRYLPLLRRFQEQWKLSRLYGIANWIAFHRFTDLDAIGDAGSETRNLATGLLEDTGIKIAYRQGEAALPLTGALMSLSDVQQDLLRFLKQGVGHVEDRRAHRGGQTHPVLGGTAPGEHRLPDEGHRRHRRHLRRRMGNPARAARHRGPRMTRPPTTRTRTRPREGAAGQRAHRESREVTAGAATDFWVLLTGGAVLAVAMLTAPLLAGHLAYLVTGRGWPDTGNPACRGAGHADPSRGPDGQLARQRGRPPAVLVWAMTVVLLAGWSSRQRPQRCCWPGGCTGRARPGWPPRRRKPGR